MITILEIFKSIMLIIPILISVAYLTLIERKILGYIQNRKGPNINGVYGILQPCMVKLFLKECVIPNHVNLIIYIISPILSLLLAFYV